MQELRQNFLTLTKDDVRRTAARIRRDERHLAMVLGQATSRDQGTASESQHHPGVLYLTFSMLFTCLPISFADITSTQSNALPIAKISSQVFVLEEEFALSQFSQFQPGKNDTLNIVK